MLVTILNSQVVYYILNIKFNLKFQFHSFFLLTQFHESVFKLFRKKKKSLYIVWSVMQIILFKLLMRIVLQSDRKMLPQNLWYVHIQSQKTNT